jgi:uncharacterized repeat protein (TIGR01451 family)
MKSSHDIARTLRFGRNRITRPAFLLLGLMLAAGCGGGGGGGSSTTTGGVVGGGTTTLPQAAPTLVSAPALGGITATLSESQAAISVGGTVTYTFLLTNTSSAPATVIADNLNNVAVPKATLRVTDSSGRTVYPTGATPGDTPPAPPSNGVATLQPNGQISFSRTVSAFSKADVYQAVATFTVASSATDTPQTITLSPLAVTAQ